MFIASKDSIDTPVLSCSAMPDGRFSVVLQDTCFYAEAGGQPDDHGDIDGHPVVGLYKTDGVTHHVLGAPVSGRVSCRIDPARRARHSLLHSAQHLVSCVFDKDKSFTSSFHIGEDFFSIDLGGVHDRADLDQKELQINRLIWQALPIVNRPYDPARDGDLELTDGLSPEAARIVCIGDIDRNACGGTHVPNTADLRLIKIMRAKPSRGGTRIWVTAGEAAFCYLQQVANRDESLRRTLNVEEGRELAVLEDKLKENKRLQKELKKLQRQIGFS